MSVEVRHPPVWLLFAVTVTGITVNTLVAPATPEILRGLGAPRSMAGLLVASPTLPGILLAPVIGVLADRFGRREVLVPCLTLFGIAGVLAAFSPRIEIMVVLRVAQGIGASGLINLAVVLIGDHWEGAERARLIGRNAAAITVSLAVLPVLGGGLTDLVGWRGPFVLYGLGLVTAIVVARTLPPTKRRGPTLREQMAIAAPYLRSREMVASLAAGLGGFVLIFGVVLTVLPIDAEDRFGLDAGGRGILLALPAVTSTIGSISVARLQRRWGRRSVLIAGPALFALSTAAMMAGSTLAQLGLAVLVFGYGEGLLIPALQDAVAGMGPGSSRGTLVAMWVSAARLGQTLGPLGAAAVLGAAGSRTAFGAAAAFSVFLVAVVAVGTRPVARARPAES